MQPEISDAVSGLVSGSAAGLAGSPGRARHAERAGSEFL